MSVEKTVSLHERLREASSVSEKVINTWIEFRYFDGKHQKARVITGDKLATIEAAIREDATATLRAENERLTQENASLGSVLRKAGEKIVLLKRDNSALKARADALREACGAAYSMAMDVEMFMTSPEKHIGKAIEAYDAADRAGETQDEATEELGHGEPAGIPDRDHVGCDGGHPCGGDPVAVAAPSPTDADELKWKDWPLNEFTVREEARRRIVQTASEDAADIDPTDAAAEGRWTDVLTKAVSVLGDRLAKAERANADIERWLEKTDRTLEQNKGVFEKWADHIDQQIKNADDRFGQQDNAIEAVLIGLGCNLAPYGDPPTMSKDQIIDALEARQGGVPEVVTDEAVDAFEEVFCRHFLHAFDEEGRKTIADALAAALAVMGTGGGRS